MKNKNRKRKRNKKGRARVKRTTEILRWANANNGLDYMDRNLLPEEGRWGEIMSPITGIKYRVKIAKITRVR